MWAVQVPAQAWEPAARDELKEHILASTKFYSDLSHMRMVTRINAYMAGGETPQESTTSTMWRMADHVKVEYMGVTSYQDKEFRVTIDPGSRTILLSEPVDPVAATRAALQDSVLARASSIGRAARKDGVEYRVMFNGFFGYDAVDVFFDSQGWMRRITMHAAHDALLRHRDPASPRGRPVLVMEMDLPERLAPGSVNADPRSVVDLGTNGAVARGRWKDHTVFDTRIR